MPRRPPPTIPRSDLLQGILLCLRIAQTRLSEATILLDNGYLLQAAVLFSFGVEEFGKAVLLRQAYETGADPAIVSGFYDHDAKLEAAATHIPEQHLLLHGAFQRSAFQSDAFNAGQPIDFDARLSALHVEWQDGWRSSQGLVDGDLLRQNINAVEGLLFQKKVDWCRE